MITEIKNFSNKSLKEIMIERLYKKIVIQTINNANVNDINNDFIRKIRTEIKEFFIELYDKSKLMKNLGNTLCNYFDKNSLNTFDDIMETVSF